LDYETPGQYGSKNFQTILKWLTLGGFKGSKVYIDTSLYKFSCTFGDLSNLPDHHLDVVKKY